MTQAPEQWNPEIHTEATDRNVEGVPVDSGINGEWPANPASADREQPPRPSGAFPAAPMRPQEQQQDDRDYRLPQQPGRMEREPRPVETPEAVSLQQANLSRRKFLWILGGASVAVTAAAVGIGLGLKGEGNDGSGTTIPPRATGGNTLKGYRPGNINPADTRFHPALSDGRAIPIAWQKDGHEEDTTVSKLLSPDDYDPNLVATSVLVQMSALISCKRPPDGGQLPLYFSDNPDVSDFRGYGVQFRGRSGKGNPADYSDQLVFYDTADDPAVFSLGPDDEQGNPTIRLSGTIYAQRIHGGDWQTVERRDPRKAQAITQFEFGFRKGSGPNGNTISVESYKFDPMPEDFLEKLPRT